MHLNDSALHETAQRAARTAALTLLARVRDTRKWVFTALWPLPSRKRVHKRWHRVAQGGS